jgi:hypothetical protein
VRPLGINREESPMKKFLYLYFGGNQPESAEAGRALMADWMAYFQKMADKMADGGSPLGANRTVGGKAAAGPSGFSIINAATLDDAVALTKGHPHLKAGGTIQVCETMPIPM